MLSLKQLFKKKAACWETLTCNAGKRNKCPYYLNRDEYNCWEVQGTYCKSEQPEAGGRKLIICSQCDYYVTNLWGLIPTAEHKKHIRKALHNDIIQLSKVSVPDIISMAIQELKIFHNDIHNRVLFSPDHNVSKIFSDISPLKDVVRNLVSQALGTLPKDMELTISAKNNDGEEVKVVITSPHPDLFSSNEPLEIPPEVKSFHKHSADTDTYQWIVLLGKDRRHSDRRNIPRRTQAAAAFNGAEQRQSSDRRQTDRRFLPVS